MKQPALQENQSEQYGSVSSFVLKTFSLLSDPENASIISWNEDGCSFNICDVALFTQQVLPRYFKHRKYESFIRQLNMYNFFKLKQKPGHAFAHTYFLKERDDLLKLIKRKPEKKKKRCSLYDIESEKQNGTFDISEPSIKQIVQTEKDKPISSALIIVDEQSNHKLNQNNNTKHINFRQSFRQSQQNYSTLIQPSSKWLHSRDSNMWSNIKSFKSVKLSLKLLDIQSQKQEQHLHIDQEIGPKHENDSIMNSDLQEPIVHNHHFT